MITPGNDCVISAPRGQAKWRSHICLRAALRMAAYLDTSVLMALFFREDASAAVRKYVRREPELWVSRWTLAECSSAAAFKHRTGQADEATVVQARARMRAVLDDGGLQLVEVEPRDFERAAALCEAHASGLRPSDALHAALAQRPKFRLITADRAQAAGCAFHGIDAELIAV